MKRFLKSTWLTSMLVLADALAWCFIWFGAYVLRDALGVSEWLEKPINPIDSYVIALVAYLPFWMLCSWYYGLFHHREKINGLNQLSKILKTFYAGVVGSFAIAYIFKQWDLGRFVLLASAMAYFFWLYGSRSLLRAWKHKQVMRGVGVTNVAVIGVGRTARRVMERIATHPEGGYRLIGFIDPHERRRASAVNGFPVLGTTRDLAVLLKTHAVDEVFLAVPKMPQNEMMNLIVACEDLGIGFKIVSNLFQVITSQVKIDMIDEVPVIHLRNAELPFIHRALKRVMDVVVASGLLAIFALPMLLIALIVKLDSKGPVLFRQLRIGKGGLPFQMLKFRTMQTEAPAYAVSPTDPEDPRITRAGKWLRRYSFDEFPQLINVLLGQMSMVGPRPEMPFLVEQYEEWQRRRLDVKPGVTGLWQIVGRKNLPLALNLEYDFYYIKNQSLFFDIVILVKTVPAVIFGRGAF